VWRYDGLAHKPTNDGDCCGYLTFLIKIPEQTVESMEYVTFRKWLAEHGCRFDTQSEKRSEGHGTVTIHRAERTAELPLVGASHNLDPRSVRQVCEALGLDWSKRPGPEGRV
jgi:hypothetical protein